MQSAIDRTCGKCIGGFIRLTPQEAGFERRPEWDTPTSRGWLSPGGCRYMVPMRDVFECGTMCQCERERRGFPLRRSVTAKETELA